MEHPCGKTVSYHRTLCLDSQGLELQMGKPLVTVFCFKMMIDVFNLKFDCHFKMWVFPKIGVKPPKMDGENNGSKPYQNG